MKIDPFYILEAFTIFMFLPLIYGIKIYRIMDHELRVFYFYLVVEMIGWLIASIMAVYGKNNLWILNIFTPVVVGILLWLFSLWQKNRSIQFVLRICIIVFVVIWLGELIILRNIRDFTVISGPLQHVVLIFASALTLYHANKETETIITDQPRFWISSGILLFSSGMLVVMIFSHKLLEYNPDLIRNAFLIQPVSYAISQCLFFGGFRCHYKIQKYGGSLSSVP